MDSLTSSGTVTQVTINLLNFILHRSASNLPIKNTDLLAFVDSQKNALSSQLPMLKDILKVTYGILLKELESKGGGKKYICIAANPIVSMYELTARQQAQRTLLFIVLSFIFMRGGSVTDTQLKDFLATIDIDVDTDHDYFGKNVKKQIEDIFVKQLYLKRDRVESASHEENTICFSWGARADMEYNKKQVLEVVSKILDHPASYFVEQYRTVKDLDGDAADEAETQSRYQDENVILEESD